MSRNVNSFEYLGKISPDLVQGFRAMRAAAMKAGPLDEQTCELISLAAFATARIENGFKTHARRLLKEGVSPDALRQAVLVTLGATAGLNVCIEALLWVDELLEETGG